MKKIKYFVVLILFISSICCAEAVYTDEQIANAIFKAEGGYKATYLYGIKSVKYKDEKEARQICLNTIRNNRVRFKKQTKYKNFIKFLASRYAPIGAKNDPYNLNRNWIKNVRFFLNVNKL